MANAIWHNVEWEGRSLRLSTAECSRLSGRSSTFLNSRMKKDSMTMTEAMTAPVKVSQGYRREVVVSKMSHVKREDLFRQQHVDLIQGFLGVRVGGE